MNTKVIRIYIFIGSCSLSTVYNKQILINTVTNISELGWQNSQAK